MAKFIAIGDNCVDYYLNLEKGYAGGCSVNFAVYIKQLGAASEYLGAIGNDQYGRIIKNALMAQGVGYSHLKEMEGNTAVTKILLKEKERIFLEYDQGVLQRLLLTENDLEFIETHDYLHTCVYGNIEKYLKYLRNKIKIIYDFADKFNEPQFEAVIHNVNYAFLSYHKDDAYIKSKLNEFIRKGCELAVVTLGAKGSIAYDGHQYYHYYGNEVEVVDTLGAGDSFMAGFMYANSLGKNIPDCLKQGSEKAEATIGHFGAF
jgi:fructoselysine 6-kinase